MMATFLDQTHMLPDSNNIKSAKMRPWTSAG